MSNNPVFLTRRNAINTDEPDVNSKIYNVPKIFATSVLACEHGY